VLSICTVRLGQIAERVKKEEVSEDGQKKGPPAWKQLQTWYQVVSESDRIIPPDTESLFAKQNECYYCATTVSINTSHASLVSHPDQTAELILNATRVSSI
jgi:hypothetical protein